MKKCRALVTGSNAPGFVSIVKALKMSKYYDFEIIGTDYHDSHSSRFFVNKHFVLPDNRSEEFPLALMDLCAKEDVDVILPIRTDDQIPICEHFGEFLDKGTTPAVIVSNPSLMDTLLNKRKLMEYCENVIKMRVPKYGYAINAESFSSEISKLGYPEKPVVIKPSYSNGSRGFRILDKSIDKKRLFFEEKPSGIATTLDDVMKIIGNEFPEMIAMEYLPGKEYTVDVLCRKGITFAAIPRLRTKMTGGITTGGIISQDANFEAIKDCSEKIVEGFGLSYNTGVQVKENEEGIPLLLEVNPRLQGTTTMSVAAGVNIPELMVRMALEEFDYDYSPDIKWGLEMQRVWLELFSYDGRVWLNE